MFDLCIDFSIRKVYYIPTRSFERVFLRLGGFRMSKEERIKIIVELLHEADEKQIERLQCFIEAFLRASAS